MPRNQRRCLRRLAHLGVCFAAACVAHPETASTPLEYPVARAAEQVDEYHGIEVSDPYRWLEDSASEATRRWVDAQNKLTSRYLQSTPQRDEIHARLVELWDYERFGVPRRGGGRLFFTYNSGLEEGNSLFVIDAKGSERRLLLAPSAMGEGTTGFLVDFAPSPDGRYVAYAVSEGGSDWLVWRILETDNGEELGDVLRWNRLGVQWAPDGVGLYYTRHDAPEPGAELTQRQEAPDICLHRLSSDQAEDEIVYPREEDGFFHNFDVTDDGLLVLTRWRDESAGNELYTLDPSADPDERSLEPLVIGYDADRVWMGNAGKVFFIKTNEDAPNWKVVAVDRENSVAASWRVVVPESDLPIESVSVIGGRLIVSYLNHAVAEVFVQGLDGGGRVSLDLGIGTVGYFWGAADDHEALFSFRDFCRPPTVLSCDVRNGDVRALFEPDVVYDPDDFETRQFFYESKDGTRVPMFVSHRRGIELDGTRPTYLTGYGAYGVSVGPYYSAANVAWMEMGGVVAMPNLRGGGEYGEAWHWAGAKLQKQNTFDDFIAAAEWLCDRGYTSPDRLAIGGGSAGGLLVAVALNQRPDLFSGAILDAAMTDMLRYPLYTGGADHTFEFGSPEDPGQFRALLAYSPVHNVASEAEFPATLLMTGDRDDRVQPWNSYKLAAALQTAQSGSAPVLLRVNTSAGHRGSRTSTVVRDLADRWAFLRSVLAPDQ